MWEVILDSLIDTLKIVPILLLVYLLVEFLTHHKEEPFAFLTKKKKVWSDLIWQMPMLKGKFIHPAPLPCSRRLPHNVRFYGLDKADGRKIWFCNSCL